MSQIAEKIHYYLNEIPDNVKLVAVSKTKPNEDILEAMEAGHMVFGENKVQDLSRKSEELPKEIEWHYIGHLQTNKVKYIAPFVSLIHAVDSLKLLKEINKQALKNNRILNCLLQFHIASEETKFGLNIEEAKDILTSSTFSEFSNVQISGVMGMATYTNDLERIRSEFAALRKIFDHLKNEYFRHDIAFKEISMGMSNDYQIAIEEGSTMVRIGSSIFGPRNYQK